jgi:DHA1 family bicyclomycin/chloramphenicol resistance-like MFS transporter
MPAFFAATFAPNFESPARPALHSRASAPRFHARHSPPSRSSATGSSGREMAEVMSLIFMVFMIIPVIAPNIGQVDPAVR